MPGSIMSVDGARGLLFVELLQPGLGKLRDLRLRTEADGIQGQHCADVAGVRREGGIWNAQVYEAWNYGRCEEIHRICRGLSPSDADALLHASGYADASLDELSDASDEAVQEAWDALYGE